MANDAPPTPPAPGLPPNYDPNMGVVAPGLVEPGNLELNGRPIIQNDDGTHSSEYSFSFGTDKGETLVPTVVNGRFLTPDGKKPPVGSQAEKDMFKAAQDHYARTGQHLGIFDTPENADAYANEVHSRHLRPALTSHVQAAGGRTLVHPKIDAADQLMKNQGIMNQGKADYKNWLYEHSPEEFKAAYPAEYLYRKAYGFTEKAITEPAMRGFTEKEREEIGPKIHAVAKTGLGVVGATKPGEVEPVIKQGVAAAPEMGLAEEEVAAAGGRTLVSAEPHPSFAHVPESTPENPIVMASPESFVKKVSDQGGHVFPEVVENYRGKLRRGEPVEPLEIHQDEQGNTIYANGRHRAAAAIAEKVPQVPVKIIKGPPKGPPPEERITLSGDEEPEDKKPVSKEFPLGNKGYHEQNYKTSVPVKVTWPDHPNEEPHFDEVKGLNEGHALARGRQNWPGATVEKVERPATVWKSSAVVDVDPKIQKIVEGVGGVYRGQNKDGIVEITLPESMTKDLNISEPLKKFVSVNLPAGEITPQTVKAAMNRKLSEFGKK